MTATIVTILRAFPPNYSNILKAIPAAKNHGNIFTYGTAIYNPHGIRITEALARHEQTHMKQQRAHMTPENWWEKYLTDPWFRYREELEAHAVEYGIAAGEGSRHDRRGALIQIASRLASPLYGNLVTRAQAKKAILDTVEHMMGQMA